MKKGYSVAQVVMVLMFIGWIAFEVINFASTQYSVSSFVGDRVFLGISWSVFIAIAFCAIDIGGIAKIFTPETGRDEPTWVKALLVAWIMAVFINTIFTWWGFLELMYEHGVAGNPMIAAQTLYSWVPVLLALAITLIRVSIVGAIVTALDKPGSRRMPRGGDISELFTAKQTPQKSSKPSPISMDS